MLGHQRMELLHAGQPIFDPACSHLLSVGVLQVKIVVILSPVHSQEHFHPQSRSFGQFTPVVEELAAAP